MKDDSYTPSGKTRFGLEIELKKLEFNSQQEKSLDW